MKLILIIFPIYAVIVPFRYNYKILILKIYKLLYIPRNYKKKLFCWKYGFGIIKNK